MISSVDVVGSAFALGTAFHVPEALQICFDYCVVRSSFQADSVTCDADSDSDDGECEHAVEPVHAGQPVRVLSFHAPVCVINRLLVPVSVRLLPDLSGLCVRCPCVFILAFAVLHVLSSACPCAVTHAHVPE